MNFHKQKSSSPVPFKQPLLQPKEHLGTRIMAVFSKLSKAFLLPIALLPIAGVFLGVGSAITSNSINGTGIWYFGSVLNKMGDVAFGNLPILFAISTALAFTKDAGVAAITAVVGFLVMNGIQAALLHNQSIGAPNIAAAFVDGDWQYINLLGNKEIDFGVNYHYYYLAGLASDATPEAIKGMIGDATRVDLNGFKLDAAGKNFFSLLWVKDIPNGLITANIGVTSLNTGVLAAIFVGALSAWAYNKFHKTQLPSAVSFFSGTKLVPIIIFFLVIPLSFFFILIWPWIGIGLAKFGTLSGKLPVGLDSLIYEIVERSLVPFGLHHVFYAPLWWTNAGGSISETFTSIQSDWAANPGMTFGHSVIGGKWDLSRWVTEYISAFPSVATELGLANIPNDIDKFNAIVQHISGISDLWEAQGDQTMMYKVIANLNVINFTMLEHLGMNLGRFQAGKFGFMLLGLPLASLAMWLNVPKQNRSSVMGIYLSAAFTCFLTGITEPIEYTFLFLAPWLFYGVHMPLAAITFMLAGFLQTHVSMTVSGGIIDYIVFGLIPFAGSSAMTWLSVFGVLFVALGMAGLYFTSFFFAVKYGKVMVPGRAESTVETKLFTKADFKAKNQDGEQTTIPAGKYTNSTNPNEIAKYEKAAKIIEYLGGEANIRNVDACASRLRVDVADFTKVEKEQIIALGGATGALVKGTNVQIVYGGEQEAIKPRMIEILGIQRKAQKVLVGAANGATIATPLQTMDNVDQSTQQTVIRREPIFNPVMMSHDEMVACPTCEQEFKIASSHVTEIPETELPIIAIKKAVSKPKNNTKHPHNSKTKSDHHKAYKAVRELQSKYAELITTNESENPQWIQKISESSIEERAKNDGSATIVEPRQDLQKHASSLRQIAKEKHIDVEQVNLRNLTKMEVIRYVHDLSKKLKIIQ